MRDDREHQHCYPDGHYRKTKHPEEKVPVPPLHLPAHALKVEVGLTLHETSPLQDFRRR
jgi:hypothetical protein